MKKLITICAVLCMVSVAGAGGTDWSWVSLHPAGARESRAYDTTDAQQVGFARFDVYGEAGTWSGAPGTWASLPMPTGGYASVAYGTAGDQQAGQVYFVTGESHAVIWSEGGWVDLHPAGQVGSFALATTGVQQVGRVEVAEPYGERHGAMWFGSPLSWVDLHPAGAWESVAYDTSGDQQAGAAVFEAWHAGIWSGSATSWVDLNPAGATSSKALATTGIQQAGYAVFGGAGRASIWSGAPATWMDLHPAGASSSVAYDTTGAYQVGSAIFEGVLRAGVWSGSPESWEDLQDVLPGYYGYSEAWSVYETAGIIYVAGYAYNSTLGRDEAVLWLIPEPTTAVLLATGIFLTFSVRRNRPAYR